MADRGNSLGGGGATYWICRASSRQRRAGERQSAGQQPISDDAERPQVGLRARPAAQLLRGHVVVRAAGVLLDLHALVPPADAEIGQDEAQSAAGAIHEDIGRLDVAVDDLLGVGGDKAPPN